MFEKWRSGDDLTEVEWEADERYNEALKALVSHYNATKGEVAK